MEYEICYLIGESKEAESVKIKEKIKKIIAGKGGSFSDFEFKDKRKMAYEIENEIRGTFFANRFKIAKKDINRESEAGIKSAIDSIIAKLYLEKDILRFIIVKADSVPSPKKDKRPVSLADKQVIGYKRQAVSDKQEKKESVKQVEKSEEKKPAKKELSKKTGKAKKSGDIDKKLEEILKM